MLFCRGYEIGVIHTLSGIFGFEKSFLGKISDILHVCTSFAPLLIEQCGTGGESKRGGDNRKGREWWVERAACKEEESTRQVEDQVEGHHPLGGLEHLRHLRHQTEHTGGEGEGEG